MKLNDERGNKTKPYVDPAYKTLRDVANWPLTKQNNRRCHNIYSSNKKISHQRELRHLEDLAKRY